MNWTQHEDDRFLTTVVDDQWLYRLIPGERYNLLRGPEQDFGAPIGLELAGWLQADGRVTEWPLPDADEDVARHFRADGVYLGATDGIEPVYRVAQPRGEGEVNWQGLQDELAGNRPAPTMQEIIDMIPPEKRIIVTV